MTLKKDNGRFSKSRVAGEATDDTAGATVSAVGTASAAAAGSGAAAKGWKEESRGEPNEP